MAEYKITVLEIGGVPVVPGEFYFGGLIENDKTYFNPFSMTLLQSSRLNILIDSGIDTEDETKRAIIEGAGAENVHSPAEVLATVGLSCADIDAVILTHAHFDHASGLNCYPNAIFYLQRRELEGWRAVAAQPKYTALHCMCMDMTDLARFAALEKAGRLVLLGGDAENLFPGISIKQAAFGHSFASQIVLIETAQGRFIHVGDVANRPENLTGTEEFPFYVPNTKFAVGSAADTARDYDRILDWAGDIGHILMTHDASRRDRFPWHKSELGLGVFEIC